MECLERYCVDVEILILLHFTAKNLQHWLKELMRQRTEPATFNPSHYEFVP
jgi:hypothetical protein